MSDWLATAVLIIMNMLCYTPRNLTIIMHGTGLCSEFSCLFPGGWPSVGINRTRSGPWDINDRDGFLTEIFYGSGAFFGMDVIPDPGNSSRNLLAVSAVSHTVLRQNLQYIIATLDNLKALFVLMTYLLGITGRSDSSCCCNLQSVPAIICSCKLPPCVS